MRQRTNDRRAHHQRDERRVLSRSYDASQNEWMEIPNCPERTSTTDMELSQSPTERGASVHQKEHYQCEAQSTHCQTLSCAKHVRHDGKKCSAPTWLVISIRRSANVQHALVIKKGRREHKTCNHFQRRNSSRLSLRVYLARWRKREPNKFHIVNTYHFLKLR